MLPIEDDEGRLFVTNEDKIHIIARFGRWRVKFHFQGKLVIPQSLDKSELGIENATQDVKQSSRANPGPPQYRRQCSGREMVGRVTERGAG